MNLFLTFYLYFSSFSVLTWQQNRPIKWEYFTQKQISVSATSATEIYLYLKNGVYYVQARFLPRSSYVSPDCSKSDYVLHHEQLHFDITELFARKLRKAIADGEKDIDGCFNRITSQWNRMQERYDQETDHSGNRQMQDYWDGYITKELELLKQYK